MSPSAEDQAAMDSTLRKRYALESNYDTVAKIMPHEPLDRYESGGFHPVALGDCFHENRYKIHHKLGFGGSSTVWLAWDSQDERWVSLKIKQSRRSPEQLEQDHDVIAQQRLEQRHNMNDPEGARPFALLLDYFQLNGPNGTHTCIVTELLGPTISMVLSLYNDWDFQETLRPDTTLRASRQLLEAISRIHKAGIAHGDVSPSNIAFTCNCAFESDEDFWQIIGKPVTSEYEGQEPLSHHLPRHLVATTRWAAWTDDPIEDIRFIDWGESFPINETRQNLAQPGNLKSPETFFLGVFDYQHDLWRAGSVIYTLFFQRSICGPCRSDDQYVQEIAQILGPLPPEWNVKLEDMVKARTRKSPLDSISETKRLVDSFEDRLGVIISNMEKDEYYEICDYSTTDFQGLKCLLEPIQGLMQHQPDKRISAEEAASYIEWIDQWREPPSSEDGVPTKSGDSV